MKRKRLVLTALKWLVVAIMVWVVATGIMIWNFGETDHARKSDCIIVLGAAVDSGKPSPVFAERIKHAITLYNGGLAPKIIFTGGCGSGDTHFGERGGEGIRDR